MPRQVGDDDAAHQLSLSARQQVQLRARLRVPPDTGRGVHPAQRQEATYLPPPSHTNPTNLQFNWPVSCIRTGK